MRFSLGLLTATFVVMLNASPVQETTLEARTANETISKRNVGGIYLCTDINWGGECEYNVYGLNECWEVTGDFYYTVSSFGVDQNTLCTLWYDSECSDHGSNRNTAIVYPGWSDLTQVGWNDAIGSFSCEYWVSGGK